jgi:hypothetical protein
VLPFPTQHGEFRGVKSAVTPQPDHEEESDVDASPQFGGSPHRRKV